ncbi:hypothetical protein BN77_2268 [Rhizobium mesoamericanum STM3625]|uniref:Uncharacterized protein n=1 Tax=Rhizobium mesoamericanum STM3625 TaxID=1211777 RepID=K0PVD3_9HYPH|nr:hypothetical protein BN77_2268 [Rhizobium mesoamericanum STM3625]
MNPWLLVQFSVSWGRTKREALALCDTTLQPAVAFPFVPASRPPWIARPPLFLEISGAPPLELACTEY